MGGTNLYFNDGTATITNTWSIYGISGGSSGGGLGTVTNLSPIYGVVTNTSAFNFTTWSNVGAANGSLLTISNNVFAPSNQVDSVITVSTKTNGWSVPTNTVGSLPVFTQGISSPYTNNVNLTSGFGTGWTNNTGVDMVVYVNSGTGVSLFNRFGNFVWVSQTITVLTPIQVKNGESLTGTAVTYAGVGTDPK